MTSNIYLLYDNLFSYCARVLIQKDARLLRDLRIMAYFRQCFPSNLNITTIKELANALASHPPYQVPISSIKIRHLHSQVGSWHMNSCAALSAHLLPILFIVAPLSNFIKCTVTTFHDVNQHW
jgi:hypothetical protein